MRKSAVERLMAKVYKTETCWLWQGSLSTDGYGRFAFLGKNSNAHRVSWRLHVGPIPHGLSVLHKCDNRPCVNPDHLYLGTQAQNNIDCVKRKRHHCSKKEKCLNGHPFNSENTQYIEKTLKNGDKTIWRRCVVCSYEKYHANK